MPEEQERDVVEIAAQVSYVILTIISISFQICIIKRTGFIFIIILPQKNICFKLELKLSTSSSKQFLHGPLSNLLIKLTENLVGGVQQFITFNKYERHHPFFGG